MVGALASADVMGLFLSTPPPPPPHPTKVNARKRLMKKESGLNLKKLSVLGLIADEANLDSCLDRLAVKVFV
jgi:hypothetical protein